MFTNAGPHLPQLVCVTHYGGHHLRHHFSLRPCFRVAVTEQFQEGILYAACVRWRYVLAYYHVRSSYPPLTHTRMHTHTVCLNLIYCIMFCRGKV
jgi:hypothetical protein